MKVLKLRGCRVLSCFMAAVLMVAVMGATSVPTQAKSKKQNVVVLYFSNTGTTESVAKKIRKSTKGKLIEIKAEDPYTEKDLDWGDKNSRVTTEHESADSPAKSTVRPKIRNLKTIKKAIKKANVVYIGYPIWWGEAPHILYTLVENVNMKKKTVVPFCTSMSSGLGSSAIHLKKNAVISKKTKWLKGRNFYDGSTQKKVDKWIKSLKY